MWHRWVSLTFFEQLWVILWSPILIILLIGGLLIANFLEARTNARWLFHDDEIDTRG